MENLSHSVSKKICNGNLSGNGFAAKAVYDDVFGGPPKSGIPTFSPRVEDYGEIFGGFHASRSSSIPVLDLPVVDEAEVCFDVRSSKFDYAEVFGGLNGLDFAFSFEELFDQSNGGNESSEEAWTPAGTDSLSEGSDPSVHSGTSQGFSSGECHQTWDDVKQFNISYHKASQSVDNMPDGTHVTQIHAIPGFTFVVDEISPLQKAEGRNSVLQVTDDMNLEMDFSERNIRGKHFGKSTSHPPNNSAGIHTLRKEIKSQRLCSENGSHPNEFVTVSEISLKTPPSELPPPSRPPPIKKGEPGGLVSDRKETNSYAFEGTTGDGSPPFFDVEVDASSSAAASAAAMKEAMEQAQAKLKSAKESMERKKEGRQSRVKHGSKSDVKDKEVKVYKVVNGFIDFKDKRVRGMHEEEENEMKPFVGEESHKVSKTTLGVPYSVEGEEFFDVVEKSKEKRHGEEAWSSQESYMSQTAGEWKEANEFFELVKTDKSRKPVEQANNQKIQVQNTKAMEFCHTEYRTAMEAYEEQEENPKKISAAGEAQQQEEKGKKLKAAKEAHRRQEYEKVNVNQEVHELKEDDKKLNVAYMHGETKEIQAQVDAWKERDVVLKVKQEETGMEVKDAMMHNENEQSFSNTNEGMVNERRLREVRERRENGRRLKDTYQREEYKKKLREAFELAETERPEKDENEVRLKDAREQKDIEKSWKEAFEREENEKMLKEALELEGNEKKLKEAFEFKEYEKKRKEACEREEKDKKLKEALEREENEKRLKEAHEREEIEKKQREAHEREEHERKLREAWKKEEVEERVREVQEREDKKILRGTHKREANEKEIKEVFEQEEIEERSRQARRSVESEESINDIVEGVELKEAENFKAYKEVSELDGKHNLRATEVAFKHEENNVQLEATQGVSADEESERLSTEPKDGDFVVEAVEKTHPLLDDRFGASGLVQGHLQPEEIEIGREDVIESVLLDDNVKKSDKGVIGTGQAGFEENIGASQMGSDSKNMEEILCHGWEQRGKDVEQTQVAFDQELNKDEYKSTQVVNEGVKNGRKTEAAASRILEGKGNNQKVAQHVSSGQGMESKKNNVKETLNPEEREKEERIKRERELEKDRLRKLEEEREREREREKDRMAVERATREVRERAYAEARERAERAAVERATAEARQRAMAEARERLEKACAEARGKSLAEKASMEARIRAERVAVERATAGARERAVEKAMVEKAAFEARERTERSASSSGSRYPYSSIYAASMEKFERVEGESAQRSKARLERHRRTAERAAKALAEKNMRDLLAQREQTERNRLAESLDADVRRWSSGKEGNLRALLSTLQYILGPDSGWQPIPLTDVITAAAVKKAYRKATLCVHPDKLQQRGASIHQKYICEKVFDLLKEAWNRFNSEER